MRSCELCAFQYGEKFAVAELGVMPTICFFVLKELPSYTDLDSLIRSCLSVGAISFATYGDCADDLEDQIDLMLEDGSEGLSNITTTSHQEEPAGDVVNFLVNALCVNEIHCRLLMIVDARISDGEYLLSEAKSACAIDIQNRVNLFPPDVT